jgi:3-oxosteroid 1-dehydrogenase
MIFDRQFLKRYMLANSLPGIWKPRTWYRSGFLKRAATLEGLAKACGMAPGSLEGTVERFNGFVASGRDEDFGRGDRAYDRFIGDPLHRPSQTLGAIEKPPFFAMQIYPGDIGTCGGIITDEHGRALRADGSVILGLYATGNSTLSVFGNAYPGPGATVGPTCTFGFIAAHHAARAN